MNTDLFTMKELEDFSQCVEITIDRKNVDITFSGNDKYENVSIYISRKQYDKMTYFFMQKLTFGGILIHSINSQT